MSKIKAKLVQIFGLDIGSFLISHNPSDYASNSRIVVLLENDNFLNAPSQPHETDRDRKKKLLDRIFRGPILIRVRAFVNVLTDWPFTMTVCT